VVAALGHSGARRAAQHGVRGKTRGSRGRIRYQPEARIGSRGARRSPERRLPRGRERRWRILTSLLVTIAGVALSAWLLPAFTRRWDDRQKAAELKATLVTDIATASADAMVGASRNSWQFPRQPDVRTLGRDWMISNVQIDARLRAYFPRSTVLEWRTYARWIEVALTSLTLTPVGIGPDRDLGVLPREFASVSARTGRKLTSLEIAIRDARMHLTGRRETQRCWTFTRRDIQVSRFHLTLSRTTLLIFRVSSPTGYCARTRRVTARRQAI